MERYRVVDTPLGPITYLLVKKRVKNLNLHIRRDGTVVLSIPTHCPLEQACSKGRLDYGCASSYGGSNCSFAPWP